MTWDREKLLKKKGKETLAIMEKSDKHVYIKRTSIHQKKPLNGKRYL